MEICLICLIFMEIFADGIVLMFNANKEMLGIATTGLRVFMASLPVAGFQIFGKITFWLPVT